MSKASDTQLLLEKFLSYKDDSTFLGLPSDEERQRYIDEKVEEQVDLFGALSVKPADSLGTVEWLDERHESLIVQFQNRPQFMGRKEDGKFYLSNEETLFLIEKGSVICHRNSLQLSLQDAFDLMLSDPVEFERYLVYAHLLRLGYRVKRCDQLDVDAGKQKEEQPKTVDFKENECEAIAGKTEKCEEIAGKYANEEMQTESCTKRPAEQSGDQQQSKRTKPTEAAQPLQVTFVPLDQLMQDLDRFKTDDKSDFLKFIRFRKLAKAGSDGDWQQLESEYSRSQLSCSSSGYQSKRSFVADPESLEELVSQRSSPEAGRNEKLEAFRRDFLSDTPLIHPGESLTDEQIQQRLSAYGPQLDSSDSFSAETFSDDLVKATDPMNRIAMDVDGVPKQSDNTENRLKDAENRLNNGVNRSVGRAPDREANRVGTTFSADRRDSLLYDYDVYLPNKKQRIQNAAPDYLLKILHSSRHLKFPFSEIFRLNARVSDPRKLLFVHCQSNELNFYQFTDVELANSIECSI